MKTFFLILGAIVVLVALALGCIGTAYNAGVADERAAKVTESEAKLREQFDLGRKAGVEYEEWFCENPEYAGG